MLSPVQEASYATHCAQHPQLQRRVKLEVEYVQPQLGTAQAGGQPGCRKTQRGWPGYYHHVGSPPYLTHHREKTASGEACQMRNSLHTRRLCWDPRGTPPYLYPSDTLAPVRPGRMSFHNPPLRVKRRRHHHPDFVVTCSEPLAHLAIVLSDTNNLRSVAVAV